MTAKLEQFTDAFRAALRGDASAFAGHLNDPEAAARIAVYQNNRATALAGVLAGAFPAVAALVGEKFMQAVALAYADAHPPGTPVLWEWGAAFPDFIAGFPPAKSLPYLADVARLDRAWSEVHYAADPDPEAAAPLARLGEDELTETRFEFTSSARLAELTWPVRDVWMANREGRAPEGARLEPRGEPVLVWRGKSGVTSAALDETTAPLARAFAKGRTLGEGLADAADAQAALQLFSTLLADTAIAPVSLKPGDAS